MDFGDFLWSLLVIYFIFFYFMILFRVIGDLFSDKEAGGFEKTMWLLFLLFLPFLSLFIYLITKGSSMAERQTRDREQMVSQQEAYIREVASSTTSPADQVAQAKAMLDSGAITEAEYARLKDKALA